MILPAITIMQPHASLLLVTPHGEARPLKRFETRSWKPTEAYIAGLNTVALRELARHWIDREGPMTNPAPALDAQLDAILSIGISELSCLPRGAVLGTAVLSRVHRTEDLTAPGPLGDFADGRFAWEFADHHVFPEPILARGKQGIWRWDL